MSYILEGLKKLEQKRQQEEKPPQQLSFQGADTQKYARKSIWPYLIFTVLLLNAGVFIWWIGFWRSTERNTPTAQSAVRKNAPTAVTLPVIQKGVDKPVPTKELHKPKSLSSPAINIPEKETKKTLVPVTKETLVPRQPSIAMSTPEKSKPPADGRIVKMNDLPSEIRNSLPNLKMSAHFYSADQPARFARVNDKILHEGETLSEGLKVEEINTTGTVFNYKGYRFQIGINENR